MTVHLSQFNNGEDERRKRRRRTKKILFSPLRINSNVFVRSFLSVFLSPSRSLALFFIHHRPCPYCRRCSVVCYKLKRIVRWLVDEEDGIERTSERDVIRICGRCQCSFSLFLLPSSSLRITSQTSACFFSLSLSFILCYRSELFFFFSVRCSFLKQMDSDHTFTNGTNGHTTMVDDENPQPPVVTTTTTDPVCQ